MLGHGFTPYGMPRGMDQISPRQQAPAGMNNLMGQMAQIGGGMGPKPQAPPPAPPMNPAVQSAIQRPATGGFKMPPRTHAQGTVLERVGGHFGVDAIATDPRVRQQFHQQLQQDPRFAGSEIYGTHGDKLRLANGQVIDYLKDVDNARGKRAFAWHVEGPGGPGGGPQMGMPQSGPRMMPPSLSSAIAPQGPPQNPQPGMNQSVLDSILQSVRMGPQASYRQF